MWRCCTFRLLLSWCATLQQGPCGKCSMIQTDVWAPAVTTVQQEPCRICSMIQTVRLARARVVGPSAEEHDLDPERLRDAYRPHSVWLWPWSDFHSFGGDCFTRGWWDFQIPWVSDDAYGPHRVLNAAVASWPKHECGVARCRKFGLLLSWCATLQRGCGICSMIHQTVRPGHARVEGPRRPRA
jgi:hypothetical protein